MCVLVILMYVVCVCAIDNMICDVHVRTRAYMTERSICDSRCGYCFVRLPHGDGVDDHFVQNIRNGCKNILAGERPNGLRLPGNGERTFWECKKDIERCFLFWDIIQEVQCLTNNVFNREHIQWQQK